MIASTVLENGPVRYILVRKFCRDSCHYRVPARVTGSRARAAIVGPGGCPPTVRFAL